MNNALKWSGCAFVVAGAILTAMKNGDSVYFFNLGAFLYAVWGWRIKEMSIVVVNVILLVIYTIGCCVA
jgi:hypothetical protein